MAYEHEDDDLERLKQWWKENGTATITGIALGVTLIFGWKGWQTYSQTRGEAASHVYEQVLGNFGAGQNAQGQEAAKKLLDEFSGSTYAALTSLLLAKQAADENKPEVALAHLDWAIANADLPQLATIAGLRKTRLLLDRGDITGARQLLEQSAVGDNRAFAGLAAVLKGDIYLAEGSVEEAKQAYKTALDEPGLSGMQRREVQLKYDNLGTREAQVVAALSEADLVVLAAAGPQAEQETPDTPVPAVPAAADSATGPNASTETPAPVENAPAPEIEAAENSTAPVESTTAPEALPAAPEVSAETPAADEAATPPGAQPAGR